MIEDQIKLLRKKCGLSQTAFGDKLGVSRDVVNTWEHAKVVPSDMAVQMICRVFGVDEHWLRFGTGEMFRKRDRADEIENLVMMLLGNEMQPEMEKLIMALKKSTPDQIKAIYDFCLRVAAENDP